MAFALYLPCKFGAHRQVNTKGVGRQSLPLISWWNWVWKPVFHVSMTTPWVFLDASIFPVILGPRPTLSRNPRQNKTKIDSDIRVLLKRLENGKNVCWECAESSSKQLHQLHIKTRNTVIYSETIGKPPKAERHNK